MLSTKNIIILIIILKCYVAFYQVIYESHVIGDESIANATRVHAITEIVLEPETSCCIGTYIQLTRASSPLTTPPEI